jgi:peptidoglycan/LPS O-acetylase OafA/YrhL
LEKSAYFENLDIMRFVAAYVVLLSHVELTLGLMGLPNKWSNPWADLESSGEVHLWSAYGGDLSKLLHALSHEMGAMAVIFFFVLSGFLITLLLLREKEVRGQIDVRRFYMRRVLRIWPLYFVVVILGLYVLPYLGGAFYVASQSPNLSTDWRILDLPYLLILPNLSNGLMQGGFPPNIGHAWSIGVEEQFYLFWPWLFLLIKAKPKWLVAFIAVVVAIKFISLQWEWPRWLQIFLVTMKFESMAIGGIGAFLYHHGWLKGVGKNVWRFMALLSLAGVVISFALCPGSIQDALFLVQSGFFLLIILAGVMLPKTFPQRMSKPLIWLGQRSYGIYMWHMMFLTLSAYSLRGHEVEQYIASIAWMVVMSSALTFLMSHLSYRWLEMPFLQLKGRFATIPFAGSKKL